MCMFFVVMFFFFGPVLMYAIGTFGSDSCEFLTLLYILVVPLRLTKYFLTIEETCVSNFLSL